MHGLEPIINDQIANECRSSPSFTALSHSTQPWRSFFMENPVLPCEDALNGSAEPKQSPQPTHRCSKRPCTKSVMHRANKAALWPPHLFRALHISIVTSTDRAIVVGYRDSKISQSIPSKMGLSSVHLMKFLCRHRKPLVNTRQSSRKGRREEEESTGWGHVMNWVAVKYPTVQSNQ